MIKYKTTIILLLGILALFYSSFAMDDRKLVIQQLPTQKDSINVLLIPIDSLEKMSNLSFKPYKKKAHASYYADKFNGRRTASGKRFNNQKYTAAHRRLPFGTKLRVTNEENGKCIFVEVTDRGPFTKNREIDLSKRAFMDIASNKRSGALSVKIEVIY